MVVGATAFKTSDYRMMVDEVRGDLPGLDEVVYMGTQDWDHLLAAGDSVGATPPISSFFGDKPTIEAMNMMGIGLDGLGNHKFDRGQEYLRTQLMPLANFPFVSANIVDAGGNKPPEVSTSKVFDTTCGRVGGGRWGGRHPRARATPTGGSLR